MDPKEALLKATGFGLRIAPDSIALSGLGEESRTAPIRILEAPDLLRDELSDRGVTPVFAGLGDWRQSIRSAHRSPSHFAQAPTLSGHSAFCSIARLEAACSDGSVLNAVF